MSLRKIALQKELTDNNPQQMLFAEEVTAVKKKSFISLTQNDKK
jgi:hypothetical protein